MATRHQTASGNGKVRIRFMDSDRFMDIEMEGSNEALLEGIRQIATRSPVRVITKGIPAATFGAKDSTNGHVASTPSETGAIEPDGPEEQQEASSEAGQTIPATPRVPKGPRKFRPPELSKDLRLDDPLSLKDFVANTTVTVDGAHWDKAIVFISFLQHHRERAAVSGADLYTCYKHMEWPAVPDFTAPMRQLKKKGKLTTDGSGNFLLTTDGENHFFALKKK